MSDITRTALLLIAAALLVTLGFMVWLIGADLFILAAVLTGAVGMAAIIAASALPIRAWRKQDMTGEANHYYHDGTRTVEKVHTIDGRTANNDIRLLQLPAAGQATAYPELLRASYRAGLLAAPGGEQPQPAELRQVDPATTTADDWNYSIAGGDFNDWNGTLRP